MATRGQIAYLANPNTILQHIFIMMLIHKD
jgi:hypothetical protein